MVAVEPNVLARAGVLLGIPLLENVGSEFRGGRPHAGLCVSMEGEGWPMDTECWLELPALSNDLGRLRWDGVHVANEDDVRVLGASLGLEVLSLAFLDLVRERRFERTHELRLWDVDEEGVPRRSGLAVREMTMQLRETSRVTSIGKIRAMKGVSTIAEANNTTVESMATPQKRRFRAMRGRTEEVRGRP